MKKAPKIEYGIEITKPWSPAMYAHNEEVADQVRGMLMTIFNQFADSLVPGKESKRGDALQNFGTRVVGYGGWVGFSNARILQKIEREIENAPFYRLREIAKDLNLKLEKGFVGF
jgi:hypothetical protein